MWGLLSTAPEASAELPSGYGAALLQALLALMAVSILAWVVLRWAAKVGFGVPAPGRAMRVVDRVPLDARRALHLVEVGGRYFLVGVGDGAAPSLLAELEREQLPETVRVPRRRGGGFAEVLGRVAAARGGRPGPGGEEE